MTIHYLTEDAAPAAAGRPSRTDFLLWTVAIMFIVAMVLLVPF